jgi:rhamnogalacturonyl hydrolase YesR
MKKVEAVRILEHEAQSARLRSELLRQMHTHLLDVKEQHLLFRTSLEEQELAGFLESLAKAIMLNYWGPHS